MVGARVRRPIVLLVLGSLAILLAACASGTPPPPDTPLAGTSLGGDPAPAFRLLDATGAEVELVSLRGRPVVLTFQYSYCPDTLPGEMEKFLAARDRLGTRAEQVAFVIVTVDPERDSVARLHDYLESQGALAKVAFLTGERAALEPLWKAYHLWVNRFPVTAGSPDARRYGAYSVGHTEVIYLLDKLGRMRSLMRPDLQVDDLVANLEALLRE